MARTSFATDECGGLILTVTLSERNLWTLLSKLYTPGSRREITNNDCPAEVAVVHLLAEPDEVHYLSSARGLAQGRPGPMHPVTEAIVARVRPAIEAAVAEIGPIVDWEDP
jgi:hypothetical protein